MNYKYFLILRVLPFLFVNVVFWLAEVLNFQVAQFISHFLKSHLINISPPLDHKYILLYKWNDYILSFIFGLLTHMELMFCVSYVVKFKFILSTWKPNYSKTTLQKSGNPFINYLFTYSWPSTNTLYSISLHYPSANRKLFNYYSFIIRLEIS